MSSKRFVFHLLLLFFLLLFSAFASHTKNQLRKPDLGIHISYVRRSEDDISTIACLIGCMISVHFIVIFRFFFRFVFFFFIVMHIICLSFRSFQMANNVFSISTFSDIPSFYWFLVFGFCGFLVR